MASISPSVSRGKGGGVVRAEASTQTMVGLHRANAQLQQELDKIDRQAFTAVSNIANHQQAMKMSWRRLEAQRNSPKSTRAKVECSDQQPAAPRKGLLMSSNKTRLYVSATPNIYSGQSSEQQSRGSDSEGETVGSHRASGMAQDDTEVGGRFSRQSGRLTSSSPYVSSPFMYR
ncbi:hypothetical protein GBAR_LOCUS25340 [Geodia barretti]|nr:hypothetical protein GBAR_LOCUS25340 [Geodia barretti]